MNYKQRIKLGDQLERRGMSQKELAELTGIRPNAISNLVRGFVERITINHIERIASALDISDINELLTLEEAKKDEAGGEESTNQ